MALEVVWPGRGRSGNQCGPSSSSEPAPGAGERLFLTARQLLEERGVLLVGEHLVERPEEALERVRSAVHNGVPLVIVGGGDGTIRAVLPAVARREVVLGILPLGTANNFARSVGVPMDLAGAVDAIADGREVVVDLGSDQRRVSSQTISRSGTPATSPPRRPVESSAGSACSPTSSTRRVSSSASASSAAR